MNFKPFYVKTEGLLEEQAQELLNLAVKNGAKGEDSFQEAYTEYEGIEYVNVFKYFGVSSKNYTKIEDNIYWFGEEAVELTYEQALLRIRGEVTVESQKAIADEILDKCKAMAPHMILAGGAPRDWYFGNTCNDLDFYFSLPEGLTSTWYDSQIATCLPDLKISKECKVNGNTMYKYMEGLKRIIYATYKGQEINLIQMQTTGYVFRAVDTFSTSICKAWYKGGNINLHRDFKLTVASNGIIFLNEGYEWTDPHPAKIVERFNYKAVVLPSGRIVGFSRGSLEKAEQSALRSMLRGI